MGIRWESFGIPKGLSAAYRACGRSTSANSAPLTSTPSTAPCGPAAAQRASRFPPSSVARVHGVVRLALAQAVAWGWRSDNPATLARPGKLEPIEIRAPTAAEVAKIVEAAAQRDPELLVYVALEAETGARRGEIAALRWSDLDGACSRRKGRESGGDWRDRCCG